ncbi:membrane-binding_protein [Hexamita inflata]|uniref:Membrane-binding protein n=1 Tax=Hexamita inflata TaxID=28002 RepID=A0AA86UNQ0_9EUKA|nr:membrane-binding protein [Hexamita inflata]
MSFGTLKLIQGHVYVGQFTNGTFNGGGKQKWANGNNYEGEFKNGKRFGQGKMKLTRDGAEGYYEIYEGAFNDDLYDGKGVLMLENGETYEGDFLQGVKHGNFKITMPNGKITQGKYENGKMIE